MHPCVNSVVQSLHFYLNSFKKHIFLLWSISIFLSTLVTSVPPGIKMTKEKEPGWVRFCSGEDHFDIFANQCPAGFFWKSGFQANNKKWDCVCARGPWRRSNKWCSGEDSQRFIQGDISCFEPDKDANVEGMLYLGDQYSAWDSGTPILLTSFTSGITIRQDDFNKKWKLPTRKNDDPGILISRPREDWTVEDQNNPKLRLCLRAPPPNFDDTADGIYIYNVTTLLEGGNTDFKLAFSRTCFSWDKDDGKKWYEIIGENIDDKNLIVPSYENTTASDACQICMSVPIPEAPNKDAYGMPLKLPERRTMDDLKHVGVLTSEINLQTERLGLYWANRLLRDETDYVKENLQEVEILTKAAIMAYGTCDLNFIPKPFYQYFLLMFRRLLSESFKKYAPASPINPEYYAKIGELLNKCMERTKKIEFIVDKSCPPLYREYKAEDGKKAIPKGKTDYNAKPAKHDYLLEFIWRLKSFLHYNCFPEFMEDSVLHDLMQNQLETLFTEDVLLRWFNPSKAFKMYEHVFKMHLDLKATMSNFEKCVRVVHETSKYPVWLTRPIDQPHRVHFLSRKKRAIGTENAIPVNRMSMESEYEDMAIETIRQKRKEETNDEELKTVDTEEEETKTDDPEEEETKTDDAEEEGTKTDDAEEEGTKTDDPEEEGVKNDEPESGEGDTADDSESTDDIPDDDAVRLDLSSKEQPAEAIATDDPNAETDEANATEDPKAEPDEAAATEDPDAESEDIKLEQEAEGVETVTEVPDTEDVKKQDTGDALLEADSTGGEGDKGNKDSSNDGDSKKNSRETGVDVEEATEKGMLIMPDEESSETMYTDSSERTGDRSDAAHNVWNKFTVPGTKGFVGACIESMSQFTEVENKDMGSCW